MSILDVQFFLKQIGNYKDFLPVFLFVGDEEIFVSQSLAGFKSAFLKRYGNENPEFNCDDLHAERDDANRIVESCLTLPFCSEKKLVIVRHLEKLSDSSKKELAKYCHSPNPSTCLALLWNAKPNPATLSQEIPAEIAQKGMVVKCWRLFEDRRIQWIKEKINQMGKGISLEAADLLSREGGESLSELNTEIEKLLLFIGDKKEIQLADVRETLSFGHQSAWKFIDHFEKGKIKRAGQIIERCLEQGEEPLKLLNLIARSCRKTLIHAEEKLDADQRRNQRVSAIFNELKKSDLLLKSGQGKESAIFERLLNLCGGTH